MGKTRFAMIFHCHQPVFNTDKEIERAYKKAYFPLIETLKKFPGIKSCFHFSGNLLEWLEQRHPEYIQGLNDLISAKQIELLSGGYSEPIMPVISEKDRLDQIRLHKNIIKRLFNVSADGMWVTERVWDPCLVNTLSRADLKYAVIDEDHFTRSGFSEELAYKPCRVKKGEESVILLHGHSFLRYSIPFKESKKTLDYFKRIVDSIGLNDVCFLFADDAEKFGAWPYTYKHVYKNGWLESFLEGLEINNDWIETSTCSGIIEKISAEDIKCPENSSYKEMRIWSGGNFRNFFKKYPESGRMYSRMMSISERIERAKDRLGGSLYARAKKEIYKAQTNCPYWHGTFGGIYIPHLRNGIYKHLLKAQDILEGVSGKDKSSLGDVNDHKWEENKETVLSNCFLCLYMAPERGAKLCELDYKRQKLNLLNTIRRSRERYHKKLDFGYFSKIIKARYSAKRGGEVDIHNVLGIAEPGLRKFLDYDDNGRESFKTHIFESKEFRMDPGRKNISDHGFLNGRYRGSTVREKNRIRQFFSRRAQLDVSGGVSRDIEVVKEIDIGDDPVIFFTQKLIGHSCSIRNMGMASEFNLMIWDSRFMAKPRKIRTKKFCLKDKYSGTELDFYFNGKHSIYSYPVYTVNETEAGLCRTFQGLSLFIRDDETDEYDRSEYVLHFSLTIR